MDYIYSGLPRVTGGIFRERIIMKITEIGKYRLNKLHDAEVCDEQGCFAGYCWIIGRNNIINVTEIKIDCNIVYIANAGLWIRNHFDDESIMKTEE